MQALVIGGTGTVGSHVVRGLLDRGVGVRVLTRSEERAHALPPGAEAVIGDLTQPLELPPSLEGVEAAFLVSALGPQEADEGLAAVRLARAVGVRCLVYLSIFGLEEMTRLPSARAKAAVERELAGSGLVHSILRANDFFQSDRLLKSAMLLHGIYPSPFGSAGVNRVDVRDVADAAVNALVQPERTSGIYPLVGPRAWTGPEIAALYSRYVGRPVNYAGDDLDAWEHQARTMLPSWTVSELRRLFEHFQQHGARASDDDLTRAQEVLHHKPRTFEAYAAELVSDWKRSQA